MVLIPRPLYRGWGTCFHRVGGTILLVGNMLRAELAASARVRIGVGTKSAERVTEGHSKAALSGAGREFQDWFIGEKRKYQGVRVRVRMLTGSTCEAAGPTVRACLTVGPTLLGRPLASPAQEQLVKIYPGRKCRRTKY